MIDTILTIAAVVVCIFAAAFVLGAGLHTWAFRAVAKSSNQPRHYPREGRQ